MKWWDARNEQEDEHKLPDDSRFLPHFDDYWSVASDHDDFGSLQAHPSTPSLLAHLC